MRASGAHRERPGRLYSRAGIRYAPGELERSSASYAVVIAICPINDEDIAAGPIRRSRYAASLRVRPTWTSECPGNGGRAGWPGPLRSSARGHSCRPDACLPRGGPGSPALILRSLGDGVKSRRSEQRHRHLGSLTAKLRIPIDRSRRSPGERGRISGSAEPEVRGSLIADHISIMAPSKEPLVASETSKRSAKCFLCSASL